jgi:ADP-ribose pyrophosphatase YjhB (NUDIX family)
MFKFMEVKIRFMDKTAVLIRREDRLLMIKNDSGSEWAPISEQIQKGETLREAARRQVKAAAGVEIEFEEKVTRTQISEDDRIHWYLAGEKQPTEENQNPEKVDADGKKMDWFRSEELEDLELNSISRDFLEENKNNLVEG